jgi:hypothetical protein
LLRRAFFNLASVPAASLRLFPVGLRQSYMPPAAKGFDALFINLSAFAHNYFTVGLLTGHGSFFKIKAKRCKKPKTKILDRLFKNMAALYEKRGLTLC